MSGFALVAVVGSVLFPGVGHGLAGRRGHGVAWGLAALVTTLLIIVSVWALPVTLLVRVASAIDAARVLRRVPAAAHQLLSGGIALAIGIVTISGAQATIEAFKIPSSSMYPTLLIGDHVYVEKLTLMWKAPERGEIVVFTQPCANRTFIKRVIAVAGDTIEVRCSVVWINGTAVPATLVTQDDEYSDLDEQGGRWYARQVSRYHEVIGSHGFDTFRSRDDNAHGRGDFPNRDGLVPSCSSNEFYPDRKPTTKQPSGRLVETKPAAEATACEPQLHFVVPDASVFVMGDNRHNANDSRYWGVVPLGNVLGRATSIYLSNGRDGGWGRFGAIE